MAKLFKVIYSDGNDRSEYIRIKAEDEETALNWLKGYFFKPEALNDVTEEDNFLTWMECDKDECAKVNDVSEEDKEFMCEGCEQSNSYLELEEIEDTTEEEDFKTIYGTNEFFDLTKEEPTKKPDWNKNLAETWKANPQLGVNKLLALTLDAQAKGKELTEMKE
jgi:hypothetical protein